MAIAMPKTVQPPIKGGPPEHLIYASTAEEKLLKALGGAGMATKFGVPSYENLYGHATPSETKSYYSAPSSPPSDRNGGNSYSENSAAGNSSPAARNVSYGGGSSGGGSFSGSNGGHSYSENSAAGNSSPASREASYGGGWGNSGYSTQVKDASYSPVSNTGGSTFFKGMNYSPADYRSAGYGSYPSGQGLNAPNSGRSTAYQTPNMSGASIQRQDASYNPPSASSAGPRVSPITNMLAMSGYGQNDSGSSIAYKNNPPAQMDHIDPSMGRMPMLPGMNVNPAQVADVPNSGPHTRPNIPAGASSWLGDETKPIAVDSRVAPKDPAQQMDDMVSNYGSYRSPPGQAPYSLDAGTDAAHAPWMSATAGEKLVKDQWAKSQIGPLYNDPMINGALPATLGNAMWNERIADSNRTAMHQRPIGNFGEREVAPWEGAGFRTNAEANVNASNGTGVKAGKSFHNYGLAADVTVPRLPGESQQAWDNRNAIANRDLTAHIDPGSGLTGGSSWKNPDFAHYQLGSGGNLKTALAEYGSPAHMSGERTMMASNDRHQNPFAPVNDSQIAMAGAGAPAPNGIVDRLLGAPSAKLSPGQTQNVPLDASHHVPGIAGRILQAIATPRTPPNAAQARFAIASQGAGHGIPEQMPTADPGQAQGNQDAPTIAALKAELATSTNPVRKSQIIEKLNQLDPSTLNYGLQMRQNP